MKKITALAIAGVLVIVIGTAIFLFKTASTNTDFLFAAVLLASAVAGIWWVSRRDDLARKRDAADAAAHADRRFRELSVLAKSSQFELHVTGSSQILIGLAVALLGGVGLAAAIGADHLLGTVGAALLLSGGALLLSGSIPMLGQPIISLGKTGFKTPLTPELPWNLVDGMHLSEFTHRGSTYYTLMFSIPTLPREISRFACFHRLLHLLRTRSGKRRFHMVLRATSETPSVIYRIAQLLWTERTGRSHDWNPHFSDEFHAARRHIDDIHVSMQKKMAMGEPNLSELEKDSKAMEQHMAMMSKEMRRNARLSSVLVWGVLLLVVLFGAAKILK